MVIDYDDVTMKDVLIIRAYEDEGSVGPFRSVLIDSLVEHEMKAVECKRDLAKLSLDNPDILIGELSAHQVIASLIKSYLERPEV